MILLSLFVQKLYLAYVFVRLGFRPLNEAQLKYDDDEYHDSPFKGEQFNGWDSSNVAKYISNWFSEIK